MFGSRVLKFSLLSLASSSIGYNETYGWPFYPEAALLEDFRGV
jgi:hypothetical protein